MSKINWKTVKEYEDITYQKADGVARVAFNRPEVRNAFRPKTVGELFEALLVWNATDVVLGAYGIEEGDLILTDTLELETLDFPEVQASLESLQMAASSHMSQIKSLASKGQED